MCISCAACRTAVYPPPPAATNSCSSYQRETTTLICSGTFSAPVISCPLYLSVWDTVDCKFLEPSVVSYPELLQHLSPGTPNVVGNYSSMQYTGLYQPDQKHQSHFTDWNIVTQEKGVTQGHPAGSARSLESLSSALSTKQHYIIKLYRETGTSLAGESGPVHRAYRDQHG